jgi:hypothetical protein
MKCLLPALAAGLALTAQPVRADDPVVPGAGFPASRYEALWTKSPFAVATSEGVAESSPDYMLVGFAQVDGISYASLIERQNQEHFLISSDKPTKGITLTSITRGHDGSDTYAVVKKDGQSITLKLEQASAPAAVPSAPSTNTVAMPGSMTPQIPIPGAGAPFPNAGSTRPFIPARIHRSTIHLPPPPAQEQQPVQVHPAPPPPQ